MIELRHLRYFLAAAETQHVGQAADRLCVTPSTLSHQIRQLEELLGTQLFDRVGRNIRLTHAGQRFRHFAQRSLKEVEDGQSALREMDNLLGGILHLGVIPTYGTLLLPPVVQAFTLAYPQVRLRIEEMTSLAIEDAVAQGTLDLGIGFAPPRRADVDAEPLFEEALVLVVPSAHGLAACHAMPMRELDGLPVGLLSQAFATRRLLDGLLTGIARPDIRLEVNSSEALLALARRGVIPVILSERTVPVCPELHMIRLTDPQPVRKAALIWLADGYRTAAAREFARLFRLCHTTEQAG